MTREGLIWKIAETISVVEGKPIGLNRTENPERTYIVDLFRSVIRVVDGKKLTTSDRTGVRLFDDEEDDY
ncbi:hypothetical protein [Sorlinia euscelidii]|uniref:hypothetical protein n=1 Tax=Sorlinia euscelidii TaxID=3081148 RepID=UPI00374E1366